MTTNAYIFSWDCMGLESIVPISKYEHHESQQLINILSDRNVVPNPLNNILGSLKMRARANYHRQYEIYAIDCAEDMTVEFWQQQWQKYPQATADLIRQHGVKIYSDRSTNKRVIS